jgi:hypothetical protein
MCQTGKKHQIDLIKYTYNRQIVTNENKKTLTNKKIYIYIWFYV